MQNIPSDCVTGHIRSKQIGEEICLFFEKLLSKGDTVYQGYEPKEDVFEQTMS